MTIAEAREKCKGAFGKIPRDILILAILLLASSASFGLGYLAGLDAGQGSDPSAFPAVATSSADQVVASKNGTRFYLPGCPGADKISDANKVWFISPDAAAAAGYSPAANCPGL